MSFFLIQFARKSILSVLCLLGVIIVVARQLQGQQSDNVIDVVVSAASYVQINNNRINHHRNSHASYCQYHRCKPRIIIDSPIGLKQQKQPHRKLLTVRKLSGEKSDDNVSSNQWNHIPLLFTGARSFAAITIFFSIGIITLMSIQRSPFEQQQVSNSVKNSALSSLKGSTRPNVSTMQMMLLNNPFQQFETVGMIPKAYFDNHLSIYGYTEKIIDGDTIRVRHIPGYAMLLPSSVNGVGTDTAISNNENGKSGGSSKTGRRGSGLSDTTLLIRLYGVDAPEIAKNKNQVTQPFGIEAKEYMTKSIYHQIVKITLLRKDQYGRAVGMVETIPSNLFDSSKDMSMELARQGYAELYTGGGAEYNDKKDGLLQVLQEAKKENRGIWSLGDTRITAAEEKRIIKRSRS